MKILTPQEVVETDTPDISAELYKSLQTSLPPTKWLITMLADFEKIPLVEEYLEKVGNGVIYTSFFESADISPDRRVKTGPLTEALGNPFPRPSTLVRYETFPGNYLDADGTRL